MKKLYLLVTLLVLSVLPARAKDITVEGLTSPEYQKKFEELVKQGYRPIKSGCAPLPPAPGQAEQPGFSATFRKVKNTPAWQSRHGMSAEVYQEEFDKLVAAGYMPTDIGSGCVNSQVLYCVIFEQPKEAKPWTAAHNLFTEEFDEVNKEALAHGLKLKLKNTCETPIGPVHAAVWVQD